jgi:transposase InsO family protein
VHATYYRQDIARALHDDNCHVGFDRLYSIAILRYYFPGMYAFLHDHVRTILKCQMTKRPAHTSQIPVGAPQRVAPGERWIVDFHGSISPSFGKKYILVFINSTSFWPEMCAVTDTNAETFVQAFFDLVISRFGWSKQIASQSGNGSAFIAQLTALFCKNFNVRQCFSTAYHSQLQTRMEAFATTIRNSLRALCNKQNEWSKRLSACSRDVLSRYSHYEFRAIATRSTPRRAWYIRHRSGKCD